MCRISHSCMFLGSAVSCVFLCFVLVLLNILALLVVLLSHLVELCPTTPPLLAAVCSRADANVHEASVVCCIVQLRRAASSEGDTARLGPGGCRRCCVQPQALRRWGVRGVRVGELHSRGDLWGLPSWVWPRLYSQPLCSPLIRSKRRPLSGGSPLRCAWAGGPNSRSASCPTTSPSSTSRTIGAWAFLRQYPAPSFSQRYVPCPP